jgi:hypothetical protein
MLELAKEIPWCSYIYPGEYASVYISFWVLESEGDSQKKGPADKCHNLHGVLLASEFGEGTHIIWTQGGTYEDLAAGMVHSVACGNGNSLFDDSSSARIGRTERSRRAGRLV